MTKTVEATIEVASRLKDSVVRLHEAYGQLPAVIEKEHRAIRASEFNAVEEARIEKEAAGDRIETAFAALTRAGEDLGKLRAALTEQPFKRCATLTECVECLGVICDMLPQEAFGNQVLRHVFEGLKKVAADFDALYRQVKPAVEANRILVTTMLHNVQESYRFWQEVIEQVQVPYNAKGAHQLSGRNSGFKVKA